jgi:hypothetical protein
VGDHFEMIVADAAAGAAEMVELLLAGNEAVLVGPVDDVDGDRLAVERHAGIAAAAPGAAVRPGPEVAGRGRPAGVDIAGVDDLDADHDFRRIASRRDSGAFIRRGSRRRVRASRRPACCAWRVRSSIARRSSVSRERWLP